MSLQTAEGDPLGWRKVDPLRCSARLPTSANLVLVDVVERVKKPDVPAGLSDGGASGDSRRLAVAEGTTTQSEMLHRRLAPVVNKLIWTFLGPDPDRDDVAHDIFIKILRGAKHVRDPARLQDWAVRVAMNCIKNEFRRRKFRRFLSLDASEPATPSYHADFEGRELLLRTQRLLEALPVNERLPFTLRLLEGTSAEELAKICDCSVRTVKRRLRAGKARFERLAAQDPLLGPRITRKEAVDE